MNYYSKNISKAFGAFEFIAKAFNQKVWDSNEEKAKWQNDMELALSHGNLDFIKYELLDSKSLVVFSHCVTFNINSAITANERPDPCQGIELPVIPAHYIASSRLIWRTCPSGNREDDCSVYLNRFQLKWCNAEKLSIRNGTKILSDHHSKITGGRATAEMHVLSEARREGIVVNVSPKGDYAFLEDKILQQRVFAHLCYAPKGAKFFPGQRLSYMLISAPRGLQARAIIV